MMSPPWRGPIYLIELYLEHRILWQTAVIMYKTTEAKMVIPQEEGKQARIFQVL